MQKAKQHGQLQIKKLPRCLRPVTEVPELQPKKTGTVTITAKIGSKKYTCKVKVENPKLSATNKTLNTKDAKTATIQLNSTSQGSSVKWSTSNSKIVSIKASKNKVTMTAKKAGSATVTASVGGKKFSCKVTVEKSHNYKKGKTVAATCSKKGYTEYKCACGRSYKKTINATGKHSYTVKKNTVAATCTKDGYAIYKCKTCDKTTKKTIRATGHKYVDYVVVKEAGCVTEGSMVAKCTNKGCVAEDEKVIPATGHTYDYEGEMDGYKWVEMEETIIFTDDNGTETGKASGHYEKLVDCEEAGENVYICTTCNEKHVVPLPAKDHEYGDWTITKEATCSEAGERTHTCTVCGNVETEEIPATGDHNFDMTNGTITKAATCTEEGKIVYKCRNCDATKIEVLPIAADAHDYEEVTEQQKVVDQEAYDEVVKKTVYYCTACKEEFETPDELGTHLDDAEEGKIDGHPNYGSMASKVVKTTIHHDEVSHYETVTKHVCRRCGHVKEN